MLSRRNIRIKVMQILYSMSRDPMLTIDEALRRYQESIDQSYLLYLVQSSLFRTGYEIRDGRCRPKIR